MDQRDHSEYEDKDDRYEEFLDYLVCSLWKFFNEDVLPPKLKDTIMTDLITEVMKSTHIVDVSQKGNDSISISEGPREINFNSVIDESESCFKEMLYPFGTKTQFSELFDNVIATIVFYSIRFPFFDLCELIQPLYNLYQRFVISDMGITNGDQNTVRCNVMNKDSFWKRRNNYGFSEYSNVAMNPNFLFNELYQDVNIRNSLFTNMTKINTTIPLWCHYTQILPSNTVFSICLWKSFYTSIESCCLASLLVSLECIEAMVCSYRCDTRKFGSSSVYPLSNSFSSLPRYVHSHIDSIDEIVHKHVLSKGRYCYTTPSSISVIFSHFSSLPQFISKFDFEKALFDVFLDSTHFVYEKRLDKKGKEKIAPIGIRNIVPNIFSGINSFLSVGNGSGFLVPIRLVTELITRFRCEPLNNLRYPHQRMFITTVEKLLSSFNTCLRNGTIKHIKEVNMIDNSFMEHERTHDLRQHLYSPGHVSVKSSPGVILNYFFSHQNGGEQKDITDTTITIGQEVYLYIPMFSKEVIQLHSFVDDESDLSMFNEFPMIVNYYQMILNFCDDSDDFFDFFCSIRTIDDFNLHCEEQNCCKLALLQKSHTSSLGYIRHSVFSYNLSSLEPLENISLLIKAHLPSISEPTDTHQITTTKTTQTQYSMFKFLHFLECLCHIPYSKDEPEIDLPNGETIFKVSESKKRSSVFNDLRFNMPTYAVFSLFPPNHPFWACVEEKIISRQKWKDSYYERVSPFLFVNMTSPSSSNV